MFSADFANFVSCWNRVKQKFVGASAKTYSRAQSREVMNRAARLHSRKRQKPRSVFLRGGLDRPKRHNAFPHRYKNRAAPPHGQSAARIVLSRFLRSTHIASNNGLAAEESHQKASR